MGGWHAREAFRAVRGTLGEAGSTGGRRLDGAGANGMLAGQVRQLACVSLRTSGSLPSSRTRAAVVRPRAHSVSSAGSPVTVTTGVLALAVIRTCWWPGP